MSIKFSNTSAQTTRVDVPYGPLTGLPNGDWTLCLGTVWDGSTTGTENYCYFSSGQTTGNSITIFASPTARKLACFIGSGTTSRAPQDVEMTPGVGYILVIERRNNELRTKVCPLISTSGAPNDGSAVRTSSTSYPLTTALDGPYGMRIGERSNDRRNDNSLFRAFCIHGVLTDLEIARLAWGMDVFEIEKTPVWYVRMNDGADTEDRGPNKLVTTRSTGADPLPTGTAPTFGYVSVNSAPSITAPTINGSPQVGTTVTCTPGNLGGYPLPVVTYQWLRSGVPISGATGETYIPVVEDIGTNTLSRRDTATSSQGTATATSQPASVTAAANTISVKEIEAERIFQRIGNAASVPLEITYTGVQPASIEYQLLDPDGVTVRKAWASIGSPVVAGGTTNASVSMPQGAKKYRVQVRSKNSSGTVIASSAVSTNQFGVGDLIALVGSSSAATWIQKYTGSATNNDAYSLFLSGEWSIRPEATHTSKMAAMITARRGVVVGMLSFGVGGTSLNGTTGWINKNHTLWTNMAGGIAKVGGRIAGMFVSMGSNDAAGGSIVSRANWLSIMQQFVANVRELVGDAMLPFLWSGYNRRTKTTKTAEAFERDSEFVRMAENDIGEPSNWVNGAPVYHVQALQYELSTDGIHLTGDGFDACTTGMALVWVDALAGNYRRGPKVTAFTYSGNSLFMDVLNRNGNDLTPANGGTGITVSDASGAPGLVSTQKISATRYGATFDRNLVAPVTTKFLGGSAPEWSAPILDNGTVPLPVLVETELPTTAASVVTPPADTTIPVMQGEITFANVTNNSASISWPNAIDNVGVVSYEISLNNGANYLDVSSARSYQASNLTASSTYQVRVRAVDAAGNRAVPLMKEFTTTAGTVTPPVQTTFVRSKQRTIIIKAAPGKFSQEGEFWKLDGPKKPQGSIDPNATIDITFNWTEVLTDIQDTIASVQFDVLGVTNKGGYRDGAFATIFVSNATVSTVNGIPSIVCRITTSSNPPRIEDRTVYLNVEQQ